ncbi:MAG: ArnT family glycosyltransferase [Thermoanaerobaculales bacterium]
MDQGRAEATPRHTGTVVALALLALGVHMAVNALGGYGYFRDELYYIACSKHLAAGYVDQPPLSIFLLAVTRFVLGDSIFAIRLIPAIVSGLSTMVLGLLVRRMGGGRAAMVLASLCFLSSPHLVAFHSFFSMNSLDIFFWLLAAYALLRLRDRPTFAAWLWFGLILGLGMLNKISILWLTAGIGAAIVLTGLRSQLKRPGPYAAGLLALLVFSPFVIWNLQHGFPHLEFMRNATAEKYSSLTRLRFLVDQFRNMNPFTFLVSLPGLGWCLFDRNGKRFRALGVAFLTVFVILLANAHTKSEYIAAAYTPLFACGGVALERVTRPWRRVVVPGIGGLLALTAVMLAPFAMPILPVETYIRYARALHVTPSNPENKKMGELGQLFADMHGWEELAHDVSAAYLAIPDQERKTTVAFVNNYGEAGALELYARRYPLPRVICNHNSYWFWGVGATPITTFIRLGGARADYFESYADVTPAGVHRCRYSMPYENDLGIFIARKRLVPIEKAWPGYRHFE